MFANGSSALTLAIVVTAAFNSATLLGADEARKAEKVLAKPARIECVETPLKELLAYLEKREGVGFTILPDVGDDKQMTLLSYKSPEDETLHDSLKVMLSPLNLDFEVRNGAIAIEPEKKK